jgi:hypothetical protein
MVRLLPHGYCQCERSSWVIEQRCVRHVGYRLITRGLRPDHATIARFRADMRRHRSGCSVRWLDGMAAAYAVGNAHQGCEPQPMTPLALPDRTAGAAGRRPAPAGGRGEGAPRRAAGSGRKPGTRPGPSRQNREICAMGCAHQQQWGCRT